MRILIRLLYYLPMEIMKELKQTDRDYIYDKLIDVQGIVDDLVEQMGEDEIDEDEMKREERATIFSILIGFILGIMITLGTLALIDMYS